MKIYNSPGFCRGDANLKLRFLNAGRMDIRLYPLGKTFMYAFVLKNS